MIEVPKPIVALGFSGTFHTLCKFPHKEALLEMREAAPCLLNGHGWLLLSVTHDGYGVLVRRDDCATLTDLRNDPMTGLYRDSCAEIGGA